MAGKKLLVADDSLTIQKVIRLALSSEGYDIQAISDGADAIQQISTFRPDAVLIDVSLPTRSAFEIKREVNGMPDHAATRFVLMSSAFEKIDETQSDEVGFDGHLTKPFDPAHLRQVLSEVLAATPEPTLSETPSIQLDLPSDLPPSDFDVVEPTRVIERENDELWGKHEDTPPPPPPMDQASEHDEIRELTESTIRMSGLAEIPQASHDGFDWKVNEPSLKPPASLADMGDSSLFTAPPPPPRSADAGEPSGDGVPAMQEMPGMPGMEEAIRRQVQQTLEKMAREILPEVAERVIKAEISRLLNEKL